MRILLLAQFYPPDIGGEERHVHNLAHALVQRGHEVDVITSALPNTGAGTTIEAGVTVHRVETAAQQMPWIYGNPNRPHAAPFPDPKMRHAITAALARRHYDVVHAHNWIVNSALAPTAKYGVPLLLTLHDYSHVCAVKRYMRGGSVCEGPAPFKCLRCAAGHYGPVAGPGIAVANALGARARRHRVASFVPVSGSVASRNHLETAGVPYGVIPNFIPDDLVVQEPAPPGGPLVFVGDLTEDKGIQVLLGAYERLRKPPELLLAGRAAADVVLQVPPGARLLGALEHDEVIALIRRAGAVIVPSIVPDSCPTVVLEAMAAGRPVVAAASGGIVDMVVDGVTGLLVAPGDTAALAGAIEQVVGETAFAAELGRAGIERVSAFTASSVVDRIEALYATWSSSRRAGPTPVPHNRGV